MRILQDAYIDDSVLRSKNRVAISFAIDGHWEKAVSANKDILRIYPKDPEALNRLGKAFLELGMYSQSFDAFASVLDISPSNTIAQKNLLRVESLQKQGNIPAGKKSLQPELFIEDTGKSTLASLDCSDKKDTLSHLAPGDELILTRSQRNMLVINQTGDCIGKLDAKLGSRLIRLIDQGNQYSISVANIMSDKVITVIREIFRDPSVSSISFPSQKIIPSSDFVDEDIAEFSSSDVMEESTDDLLGDWKSDSAFADNVDKSGGIKIDAPEDE